MVLKSDLKIENPNARRKNFLSQWDVDFEDPVAKKGIPSSIGCRFREQADTYRGFHQHSPPHGLQNAAQNWCLPDHGGT